MDNSSLLWGYIHCMNHHYGDEEIMKNIFLSLSWKGLIYSFFCFLSVSS